MVDDSSKTKAELVAELAALRSRFEQAGSAVHAGEDRFRQLVEGLPQPVFEMDLEGRLVYINSFALRAYGYEQEDLDSGLFLSDILHADSQDKVMANIALVLDGKQPRDAEYIGLRKDGTTFSLKVYSERILQDGQPVGVRGVVMDITDIKAAESALVQSENHYRALFENTGTAIAIIDANGIIHNCNSQFEQMCGYPADALLGKMRWATFVDPDDLKWIMQYSAIRMEKGQDSVPNNYEFTFIARGGIRIRIHTFIRILPGTTFRVCSLIDVTAREEALSALVKSQEQYRLVVRCTNDGVWDWDLETDDVYYSSRYREMLGYTDDEYPDHVDSWKNSIHPDDVERAIAANMTCIEGKAETFEVEYRLRHKDGTYRWILGRGARSRNVDGKVNRLAGTHTDITARKLNERITRALYAISSAVSTTEDLRELYSTIHSVIANAISAENFFITLVDESAERMRFVYFADEKDEYLDILNINDPKESNLTIHVLRTATPMLLSRADPAFESKLANIRVVGTVPQAWLGVPLRMGDRVLGVMAVQDYDDPLQYANSDVDFLTAVSEQVALAITRKANEEELFRLNEKLEHIVEERTRELRGKAAELELANSQLRELDDVKSSLVSSVSHELRTPLTSIRGYATLCAKDFVKYYMSLSAEEQISCKGCRIVENLGIIEAEGDRLTRLINDFLDIHRIETGQEVWQDTTINPCEVVRKAVDAASGGFAGATGVSLDLELADKPGWIHADPDKIQQVVMNLLHNARKFTRQGMVRVAVENGEGCVRVSVQDTGTGIPKSALPFVFEKFHKSKQGDTVRVEERGTGLGLAICKEIVEHYGGTIRVESVEGEGSKFTFTLPVVTEGEESRE